MKLVRGSEVSDQSNGDDCTIYDYPTGASEMSGVVAVISGRYPSIRRVHNNICMMVAFVLAGSQGKVVVEAVEYPLEPGDLVMIDPRERYYWEGELRLFIASTPAWTPDQQEQEEEGPP